VSIEILDVSVMKSFAAAIFNPVAEAAARTGNDF
jgi:hypothetical protein